MDEDEEELEEAAEEHAESGNRKEAKSDRQDEGEWAGLPFE